jgi:hypothetical protein
VVDGKPPERVGSTSFRKLWSEASVSKRARADLVSAMVSAFGRPLPYGEAEMSVAERVAAPDVTL